MGAAGRDYVVRNADRLLALGRYREVVRGLLAAPRSRILQVTPYYAPAWAYGGPPRVMSDFASGLAARGHDVDVLTTDVLDDERRATPREEVLDGVLVRRLPNLSNSLAWRTKKYLPRGLMRRLAVEAPRYDVVHVTDIRTYLTAAAYLATRARRTPLALSAHGSLPGSTGLRGKVKDVYDMALVRPDAPPGRLLFAQTAHEARLYEQFGGRPGAIVQLPLPLPPLTSSTRRAQVLPAVDRRRPRRHGRFSFSEGQPSEGVGRADRVGRASTREGHGARGRGPRRRPARGVARPLFEPLRRRPSSLRRTALRG